MVQGVGFRPFVYREATALALSGWVRNASHGVLTEAEGPAGAIDALVDRLRERPPTNSRIVSIELEDLAAIGESGFEVRQSLVGGSDATEVLPDIATCNACVTELFDKSDRRYRYPFINCTQCGPRYSIVEDMPYDRPRTSMRRFEMCLACRREYDDPADRRFHAEPVACPDCGPSLRLLEGSGACLAQEEAALVAAAAAVREGAIVAAKGIGGFHLIVDAADDEAVRRLRARKGRAEKPFAVMFPSLGAVRVACHLDDVSAAFLTGAEHPIVLLRRKEQVVAASVAPDNTRLGVLLPYSPLHHLLMHGIGRPVVATSGNVSGEPMVTDESQALDRLAGIADLFLVHDRGIVRPVDDSVGQFVCGRPQLLRRARGFAPAPIRVLGVSEGIVGFGGHLKATVALSHPAGIVVSQHLGDLDTSRARRLHERTLTDLAGLHGARPRTAAHDLHPDYASSIAAERSGYRVLRVQHHLAHVAACLAENGLEPPALGVAWDGSGAGPDGSVWGGEFLVLEEAGWRRFAALRPFRLPGGEAAVTEPRRSALGMLYEAFGEGCFEMCDLPPLAAFSATELGVLGVMLRSGVNAPVTSSMGRLFDAFAALCDARQRASYEGQAAMALEWLADGPEKEGRYDFPIRASDGEPWMLDWQPALEAAMSDLRAGKTARGVSLALHEGLAAAVVEVARRAGQARVVLTGGCFQNVRLTETTVAALNRAGFQPAWHAQVPPNDGGLAFGQVAWASWQRRHRDG
jgi:hydrogenase maturation protein HypF